MVIKYLGNAHSDPIIQNRVQEQYYMYRAKGSHNLAWNITSPTSFWHAQHSFSPELLLLATRLFCTQPILFPVSVPFLHKIIFTARSAIVSTLLELISLHIFISTVVYWMTRLVNHVSGRICLVRQKLSWKMLLNYRTQLKLRVMKVL